MKQNISEMTSPDCRQKRYGVSMDGSDVNDIQVFVAVADANGFAAGGRRLGLSRSAAGKAVARLEARLGTRLLTRTTRSLALTDQGRILYRHGLSLAATLDCIETSMSGSSTIPQGTLRLTTPDAYGRKLILPVVRKYLDRWPSVQVEINFSDNIVNMVEQGFDLAIRIGITSPSPGLIMRVLHQEPVLLCAAPDYLARHGEPISVEDIDQHTVLLHADIQERQSWRLVDHDGNIVNARGRSRLRMNSGAALRDAALAGDGIAYLPLALVEHDMRSGKLVPILADITQEHVPLVALYLHRRHLEGNVRHFIDAVADHFRRATRMDRLYNAA